MVHVLYVSGDSSRTGHANIQAAEEEVHGEVNVHAAHRQLLRRRQRQHRLGLPSVSKLIRVARLVHRETQGKQHRNKT